MFVITLKQPWAHWVVFGPKGIENRTWVDKRVALLVQQQLPFLIHAAKTETKLEWDEACAHALSVLPSITIPARDGVVRGALLGSAKIARIVPPSQWTADVRARRSQGLEWHMQGQYGWILKERAALPVPVYCKGTLGLWKLPKGMLDNLTALKFAPTSGAHP